MGLATSLSEERLGDLHPDPHNPRLAEGLDDWSDDDSLLVYIADNFDPLSIAESITRHGFWSSDPLIVTEEEGRNVTLEGNRRLTALLGLARPELRSQFDNSAEWDSRAEETEVTLEMDVPVLRAEQRSDADALIGFRHIAGIQAWSPLQRARFIAHLVDERNQPFSEVAETVGEEESIVRLHYRNQDVLRIIADEGMEEVAQRGEERYGTFTAALNRAGIRNFLSVPSVGEVSEGGRHLNSEHLSEVGELFSWIYGTAEESKVIRETRDLTYLAEVLRDEEATEELRRTRDLEAAFALTGGAGKGLYRQLSAATGSLRSVAERAELLEDEPRALGRVDELEEIVPELRGALEGDVEAEE